MLGELLESQDEGRQHPLVVPTGVGDPALRPFWGALWTNPITERFLLRGADHMIWCNKIGMEVLNHTFLWHTWISYDFASRCFAAIMLISPHQASTNPGTRAHTLDIKLAVVIRLWSFWKSLEPTITAVQQIYLMVCMDDYDYDDGWLWLMLMTMDNTCVLMEASVHHLDWQLLTMAIAVASTLLFYQLCMHSSFQMIR